MKNSQYLRQPKTDSNPPGQIADSATLSAPQPIEQRTPKSLTGWSNSPIAALFVLLVPAALLRFILTVSQPLIVWPDSHAYLVWGGKIVERNPLDSYPIFRTPLYSLFVSAFVRFGWSASQMTALVAGQHLLGLAAIVALYFAGRRAFSPTVALCAAFVFGLHGLQLYYEQVAQTEVLFVALLWCSVAYLARTLSRISLVGALNVGLLFGLLTLTRPVGQPLVILAILAIGSRCRWRLPVLIAPLLGFMVAIAPWLIANHQARGYWGISRELGINLFHRVIDADQNTLPPDTKFPRVAAMIRSNRARRPVVYFSVWHALVREEGSLNADKILTESSLEVIRANPGPYLFNTATTFFGFFLDAWTSINTCQYQGRELTCGMSRGASIPAVEKQVLGLSPEDTARSAALPQNLELPMGLIAVLATFGAVFSLRRSSKLQAGSPPSGEQMAIRLFLVTTVLMFGVLTSLFNRQDDRFRLPVDGALILFASAAVCETLQVRRTRRAKATDEGLRPN